MDRDMPTNGCDGVDDEVDDRCDAFERAWRAGQRPKISDFLSIEDRVVRGKLFRELLLVELEYRRLEGELPKQREYLIEFPEFASQIETIDLQYRSGAFAPPSALQKVNSDGGSPSAGKYIAHFELVELLGTGAMGAAWKAWDSRLRRNV